MVGAGLLGALSGCPTLEGRAGTSTSGLAEPEVFEIIRAGNSRAVLDSLAAQYEAELQHARILRESIQELIAAEEGLSMRLEAEREAFEDLQTRLAEMGPNRDRTASELEAVVAEQLALTQQLDEAQKSGRRPAPPWRPCAARSRPSRLSWTSWHSGGSSPARTSSAPVRRRSRPSRTFREPRRSSPNDPCRTRSFSMSSARS